MPTFVHPGTINLKYHSKSSSARKGFCKVPSTRGSMHRLDAGALPGLLARAERSLLVGDTNPCGSLGRRHKSQPDRPAQAQTGGVLGRKPISPQVSQTPNRPPLRQVWSLPEKTIPVEDGQRDLSFHPGVSSVLGSLNLAARCIRSHHRRRPCSGEDRNGPFQHVADVSYPTWHGTK